MSHRVRLMTPIFRDDFVDAVTNVIATVHTFDPLGLITYPKKSVLTPAQLTL